MPLALNRTQFLKLTSYTISHHPFCHTNTLRGHSKPWIKPDNSIKLFINSNPHKECEAQPNDPQWKVAVICDWAV